MSLFVPVCYVIVLRKRVCTYVYFKVTVGDGYVAIVVGGCILALVL